MSHCWKITEKVAFNMARKASNDNILSEEKFVKKNAKNGQFWRVFENLELKVK